MDIEEMVIRMYPIIGLKGQQIIAQGNALGVMAAVATPCKGKSIILYLSAQGGFLTIDYPGRCPGLFAHCPFGALSGDCG